MSAPQQLTCQQVLEALIECDGSRTAAADKLGVNRMTVNEYIKRARKLGLEVPPPAFRSVTAEKLVEGTQSAHEAAPEGFVIKGVSSLVDEEGNVKQQWIKTNADYEQQMRMLEAAAKALSSTIAPQEPVPAPVAETMAPLCNLYTITDYHVGMLAWRKEGGADWDLGIAEMLLARSFGLLVKSAPPARIGIVNQLGDFLHTDGFQAVTPTSHHQLDADSRFPKIVEVAIRAARGLINAALAHHEHVIVNMEEGNHDLASSVWLRAFFKVLYEKDPRVTVLDSPLPYHAYQHGKTMLAFHHGHVKKLDKLPGFMAAQFPEMWGATTYRYAHTGHLHHTHEKEDNGMTVTQHPTLAARDAFASRGGWHANRAAQCVTYHEEFGQVGRNIVTPEMVR